MPHNNNRWHILNYIQSNINTGMIVLWLKNAPILQYFHCPLEGLQVENHSSSRVMSGCWSFKHETVLSSLTAGVLSSLLLTALAPISIWVCSFFGLLLPVALAHHVQRVGQVVHLTRPELAALLCSPPPPRPRGQKEVHTDHLVHLTGVQMPFFVVLYWNSLITLMCFYLPMIS